MDLKGNRITVGEILQNPRARALLLREFPMLRDRRIMRRVVHMPLWRVLQLGAGIMPRERIDNLLRQVREIR